MAVYLLERNEKIELINFEQTIITDSILLINAELISVA